MLQKSINPEISVAYHNTVPLTYAAHPWGSPSNRDSETQPSSISGLTITECFASSQKDKVGAEGGEEETLILVLLTKRDISFVFVFC